MSYASMRFRLWADIGGTIVELNQFACSYEMNRIPSCTAVLPVGYYVLPPHPPATTHTVDNQEMLQIPLKVYIQVTFISGDQTAIIPVGTYLIFCGWVTGVGYRKTYSSYAMTIEGTHWLSALSFSSTMSETSNPLNPTQFIFNSRIILDPGGGGLGHFNGRTAAQAVVTAANLTNDMWGDALKPWFLELAAQDRINRVQFLALGGNVGNDGNGGEAQDALNIIDGPLEFDDAGLDGNQAALAIADDIAVSTLTPSSVGNTLMAMANTTFWDKIIGSLAPNYMFALIPYPTKAKIVPFIPGLNEFWDPYGLGYTILARDMATQDMNAHLPRATRSVGLFGGRGLRAGSDARGKQGENVNLTIGGQYVGREDGIVIMRQAPTWATNYIIPCIFSADSQAIGAGKTRGNAFNHPGNGAAPSSQDPKIIKADTETLLNRLAHSMYVTELLKNRYGDISGPVRFDIAPGTTIKMEGTAGAYNDPGEARYGSVVRTSHFFQAQQQKCYSAFRLAHIRTQTEFDSPNFSVPRHPLYVNKFIGDYNLELGAECPEIGEE